MAVGGPGGGELDTGTAALRQLMSRAAADDSARLEALALIAQRRVLVATWPHSPESVRTLTNSDGEQAMPLFSGFDVLLDAAHRFGWTSPDGSVSHRELAAGEALRSALSNGVHFVVLDICTECTIEFGRDEVEQALHALPKAEEAAPRAPRTPSVSGVPPRRLSRRPHEGLTPMIKVQPVVLSAPIVEESVVRGRAARPDPRAEPSQATKLAMVNVTRVPQSVLQARQAAAPVQAPVQIAPVEPPAFPPSMPEAPEPEPLTMDWPVAAANKATLSEALPALDALPALGDAAPFAAGKAPAFDLPSLGSVPPLPVLDAAAKQDAMLGAAFAAPTDEPMASQGSVEEAPASGAVKSTANVVAMLGAPVDAAAKKKKRRGTKPSSAGAVAAAAPAEPASEGAKDRESGIERRELCPPTQSLDETLLSQVADALRKYPEVEWACEVSDGSDAPLIGMRVEPTFLTRVPEIKAAVAKASKAHGVALSILVLEDPQQMRVARAQGNLFFPWRKRAVAKP